MRRLLIAGFGDIARRAAPALARRFDIIKLSRDLDRPGTFDLPEVDAVLHLAPPPPSGDRDSRTANLLAALKRRPARIVYISTSGVYGDCAGEKVDESRPPNPQTPRARRRLDAETRLLNYSAQVVVLRAPGIYAADRLPLERLRAGTPVLRAEDDVYTNHIHADDLAAAATRALEDDAPPGVYNIADDTEMHMGEWMDLVARHAGLPTPPRRSREQISREVPPTLLSFMSESRRLDNRRMKAVLGVRLRYPTVQEGLKHEQHTVGVD
jgi:nucleoside-diphosphate-sugar epimerase